MKCKYIFFSLCVNEDRIPTDVLSVLGVLEVGFPKWKMGWPICAIGQLKVGTLDMTASSVDLKFIMVTVSKDVFRHKGRQIRHTLVYISKTKVNLIFSKVSCNIKARIIIKTIA